MKRNVGDTDRKLRAAAAVVLVLAGLLVGPGGWLAIVAYLLAAVMVVTAAAGFCPLYAVLGVSTCPAAARRGRQRSTA
jgi:hypothetical protein